MPFLLKVIPLEPVLKVFGVVRPVHLQITLAIALYSSRTT